MNVTTVETSFIPTTHRWSLPLLTVFFLWVLVLFDPHLWLDRGGILPQMPKFIYMALALMIVLQAFGRVWYPPFLLFVVGALMASPFAENIGYAQDLIIKIVLLYYVLAIASLTFINSEDKTTLLLYLFLGQFLWWAFHGDLTGRVSWHQELGNEDAFGPIMVIGMGYSYYFGMATRKRNLRLTAFFIAGLSMIGVVSSFARGAVIAAGVVAAYVWFRSPTKGRTFAAVVLGVGIFTFAANSLFSQGAFWEEMSTLSEGFDSGTGLDRWILWKTAWRVFLERPILGVGAGNFGVFTINHLFWSDPELVHYYNASPMALWGRPIHNIYLEVLSEFGLVGAIAIIALLVDFWKRNAELRSESLVSAWWSATRQRFDLHMLSLALEAAMIGFLVNGIFYNELYLHWFYSLVTVNAVLHSNAKRVAVEQRSLSDR